MGRGSWSLYLCCLDLTESWEFPALLPLQALLLGGLVQAGLLAEHREYSLC